MLRSLRCPIVTIDGPSGSGKGTISRAVVQHAGWHLLDSGALYRLVALAGVAAGAAGEDAQRHAALAARMEVAFGSGPDGSERVWLDGREVTGGFRFETPARGGFPVRTLKFSCPRPSRRGPCAAISS